ncbi:hypothetical protein GCM10027615_31020 [Plantactinospora veratri]
MLPPARRPPPARLGERTGLVAGRLGARTESAGKLVGGVVAPSAADRWRRALLARVSGVGLVMAIQAFGSEQ